MDTSHSELDPTAQLASGSKRTEAGRYVVRVTNGLPRTWEDVFTSTERDDADFARRTTSIREAELSGMDSSSRTVIG